MEPPPLLHAIAIRVMAIPKLLRFLPTTAALRLLAKEPVGLETLPLGTNLAILGARAGAAVALAVGPRAVRTRVRVHT